MVFFGALMAFVGALTGYFGVGEGIKQCFGAYSCSLTTVIYYVTLNSDIGF